MFVAFWLTCSICDGIIQAGNVPALFLVVASTFYRIVQRRNDGKNAYYGDN
jgi:hypothetical protein